MRSSHVYGAMGAPKKDICVNKRTRKEGNRCNRPNSKPGSVKMHAMGLGHKRKGTDQPPSANTRYRIRKKGTIKK